MAENLRVEVLENLLKANDYAADKLHREWSRLGTLCVNLLSSPGSGKTSLLEAVLPRLAKGTRALVLEGDVETDRDARRIRRLGFEAVQITTGGTCHLEAHMIDQAWDLHRSDDPYDYVFIENVGNLVCPAGYRLGEHLRAVLLSVPEGDDKPAKYPKAFRTSQALLLTKCDLLPHFDFDPDRAAEEALRLQPELFVGRVSAKTGEGVQEWIDHLAAERERLFATA